MSGDNRFCFVVPAFNAEKTIQRTLWSIAGQSYTNWRVIVINDMSTDSTSQAVDNFAYMLASSNCWLDVGSHQIDLIDNVEKKWEVANVLKGISMCNDDDIICRIDGDDWLTELDALAMLNEVYKKTECDAVWTNHRWGFSDKNISGPMTQGADVYKHPWVSSHLKTFRKHLLNDVPYENFTNIDGNLIRRAGDQAVYLPALHKAKKHIYVPRCVYHYSIDEQGGAVYQTDDAKFQKAEADFLKARGYVSNGIPWTQHDMFVRRTKP